MTHTYIYIYIHISCLFRAQAATCRIRFLPVPDVRDQRVCDDDNDGAPDLHTKIIPAKNC